MGGRAHAVRKFLKTGSGSKNIASAETEKRYFYFYFVVTSRENKKSCKKGCGGRAKERKNCYGDEQGLSSLWLMAVALRRKDATPQPNIYA